MSQSPSLLIRALTAAALLLALFALSLAGVWAPADARLWDLRFALADRGPSGQIVFVDIDAESLAAIGTWPWPRSLHGRLLDQLMAMGAYEVAFDIDFSTSSVTREDAALAASLARAGGYAYLAAFRQATASGAEVWNRPIAAFEALASAALVNVDSLEAGLVWSLPAISPDHAVRSIAAHFNPDKVPPATIRIDYGIDLARIPRVSARAILDGTADPRLIRDRQIIIGASAIELHDLLMVPRFGVVPGPLVQVAAVESVRQDRALFNLGSLPAAVLGILVVFGSLFLPRFPLGPAVGLALGAALLLEAASFTLYQAAGYQVDTTLFHATLAGVLVLRLTADLAQRQRELQAQHQQLAYLATHDEQTGTLSPAAWCAAVADWSKDHDAVETLLLRLEQLDEAGASLGYAVTDQVAGLFCQRLGAALSSPIGRIESHVFAVANGQSLTDEEQRALLAQLEAPFAIEGHHLLVPIRLGISSIGPATRPPADALAEARTALAVASRRGTSSCVFSPACEAELESSRSLDIALRSALDNCELDLAFQVQVDTRSRQPTGVEALLRWTSPRFGAVSPADFVPIAEANGAIVPIGAWVAREACRRAVASNWPGRLSINVSPVQFMSSDVVSTIRSALYDSGFPAERLDVEVTESLVAGGEAAVLQSLEALRALGVSIAIDDFGTGASSLGQLASLPVDKLKIDRSFVQLVATPRGAEVAATIARLGQRLDLPTVVEGVETESEFSFFANLGCDTVQGYLFSRPGPLPVTTPTRSAA